MRQFNLAEQTYLSQNRNLDVNTLAKALMTTEEHVNLELAKLPPKKGRGRPKKVVEAPKPVEQPAAVVEPPAMATMARVKGRGAIAMTGAASEIGDEIGGLKIG